MIRVDYAGPGGSCEGMRLLGLETVGFEWDAAACSADFGVPQTRRRTILLASRVRSVHPPEPTHGPTPTPGLFSELAPWVSMAEALGWPDTWAVEERRGARMSERHGDRPPTPATEPYPTLTGGENRRRWVVDRRTNSKGAAGTTVPTVPVPMTRPAPTFTSQAGGQWCFYRPATTVCADPRLGEPGHRDRDGGEPQFKPDAIKLTVQEALILQSFRPGYPVQGPKSKQFEQVGNAVPPVLAAHCASALTGIPVAPLAAKDPS